MKHCPLHFTEALEDDTTVPATHAVVRVRDGKVVDRACASHADIMANRYTKHSEEPHEVRVTPESPSDG